MNILKLRRGIMADRVRRPKQYDELLRLLKEQTNIFPTLKDAIVFAACLGLSRDKRVSFEKTSEPINMQTFGEEFDQMAIDVIGISASDDDPMIMATERSDERVRIFEEYACGGLEIINHEVFQGGADLEDGLIRLVLEEQKDDSILSEITDLSEV